MSRSTRIPAMSAYLPALPALIHVGFWYLESIAFPRSQKVQRLFLKKVHGVRVAQSHAWLTLSRFLVSRVVAQNAANPVAVEVGGVLLYNQGFYNLLIALATLYGLYRGNRELVQATLFTYIGAAAVLFFSTKNTRGTLAQGVPALAALLLF